jgi:hypothetical protein
MSAPGFMDRFGARLVLNGYPIIPIQPGTKKPGCYRGGGWRDYPDWTRHAARATTELELMQWCGWPDAGIGIVGGAVAAVDIDIADDAELAQRIERLGRERLGDTPALRIGRPPKRLLVYRTVVPFKGIKRHPLEVLCLGQQFVAYAIHPATGRPYDWPEENLADLDLGSLPAIDDAQARTFLDEAIALLPERLRPARLPARPTGEARATHAQQGTPDAVREALAWIPNADLDYDSWVRIGMAIKGAIGDAGADLFGAWSAQSAKNDPAVTARNWAGFKPTSIGAGTLYHHAMARGWKPDAALVLDGSAPRDAVHPAAGLLAKVQGDPVASMPARPQLVLPPLPPLPPLDRLDGVLALMVGHILATAIRPQPWLAVGASLAVLGALMGRKVRTPTNLRSNLYVLGIAESGGGKDHARKAIKEILVQAGLSHHLGGERLGSGAGLITALVRQPAALFQIDEFGRFLANVVDKRRAPKHLSEIWDLFTELATNAGTTFFGAEYADQRERPRQDIIEPCACVHGVSAPGPFWGALRASSLEDGSLARFLVFRSEDDIPDRNRRAGALSDLPQELIAAVQSIAAVGGSEAAGNLVATGAPSVRPAPLTVQMDDEALAIFEDLYRDMTRRQRAAVGSEQCAVLARVWENTAKVALVKAVSANPAEPVVRGVDAQWAREVVNHCVATLLIQADRHLADNEIERLHKRVIELIRAAGRNGIRQNELTRRTQFIEPKLRREILLALIESEQVVTTLIRQRGRPGTVYRLVDLAPGLSSNVIASSIDAKQQATP